jgi:hypothetical protein
MDDGRSGALDETKCWTIFAPIGSRKTVHGSRVLSWHLCTSRWTMDQAKRWTKRSVGRFLHLSVHGQRFTCFNFCGISLVISDSRFIFFVPVDGRSLPPGKRWTKCQRWTKRSVGRFFTRTTHNVFFDSMYEKLCYN